MFVVWFRPGIHVNCFFSIINYDMEIARVTLR